MEQRADRGADSPTEAAQTPDVWARRVRGAMEPGPLRGLTASTGPLDGATKLRGFIGNRGDKRGGASSPPARPASCSPKARESQDHVARLALVGPQSSRFRRGTGEAGTIVPPRTTPATAGKGAPGATLRGCAVRTTRSRIQSNSARARSSARCSPSRRSPPAAVQRASASPVTPALSHLPRQCSAVHGAESRR